jgi:Protein of unknown function (DUF3311)
MKHLLLIFIVIALFILHQDFWYWREASPIVFGFLPIGLFYHVCYTIAISLLMWLLVKYAWPSHLEEGEWESGEVGGNFSVSRSQSLPPEGNPPALPLSHSSHSEGRE